MRDLNVIVEPEEKDRGTSYRTDKSFGFISYMTECGMQDAGFNRNIFTWCNNKGAPSTIWKRLDYFLDFYGWFDQFSKNNVPHLV